MSEAGRKWWWRTLAAVTCGGGTVTGAWVSFIRPVAADQNAPPAQVREQNGAGRQSDTEPFERPRDTSLLPVNAAVPTTPAAPVVPDSPEMGMGLQPPASLPLPPAPVSLPLPPPPAMPEMKPIVPVAAPFPPSDIPALPSPSVPALPALPALPKTPSAPAPLKVESPPVPVTPAVPVLPVPAPVPSRPSVPVVPDFGPEVPPSTGVTPPPLPVKVAEPALPSLPAKPDSGLPGSNAGINVKSDKASGNTGSATPVVPVIPPPTAVKTPVVPVEPPSTAPKLPAIPTTAKPTETPGTVVGRPKPTEPPLPEIEKNFSPIPSNPPVQTPGESTMIPLTRSAAAAVLGGMLLTPATPVKAEAPVVPITSAPVVPVIPIQADDKTDAAELKKQLEESNRKLTTIQDQLRQLTELLNGKKDEKGFPLPSDPGLVSSMKELKDRLAQIEKDLAAYKSQTSLRPTTPANPIVEPKATKGTVRVVNEYPVQISIVVNGTSYRVAPSKALDVDVPAGEFSYQLLESGGAVTKSTIKEKETVTLRIK